MTQVTAKFGSERRAPVAFDGRRTYRRWQVRREVFLDVRLAAAAEETSDFEFSKPSIRQGPGAGRARTEWVGERAADGSKAS